MKKRIMSLVLTVVMILGLIPSYALAAPKDATKEQVHVIVENTTFSKEDGAPWEGVLVDTWVTLKSDSTMMSCIVDAIESNGFTQSGAENNYIESINGMGEFDGGYESGWMGTLNDWFTNEGFDNFGVENGKLFPNDEIRVMYTCEGFGADLGADWFNTSTALKGISFSEGKLNKEFKSDVTNYELLISRNVQSVKVSPTAENKNYQVSIKADEQSFRRTQDIPVNNNTEIKVTCGDTTTYTFKVCYDSSMDPEETLVNSKITMNSVSPKAKLYSCDDKDKKTNLLEDKTPENNVYALELKSGKYLLEAIATDGITSNGTIELNITQDNNVFQVWTVTAYASNSGWVYGTDYTIENLKVRSGGDKASVERTVTLGESLAGKGKTFLVLNGDTYDFFGTPTDKNSNFAKTYKNGTVTASNYCTASFSVAAKVGLTVTYPYEDSDNDGKNDYVLESGQMTNYYIYTYNTPLDTVISEDKLTVKETFDAAKSGAYYYRVSNKLNNSVVTYGNYVNCTANENEVTVTKEMMYADDTSVNKDTIIKDFSKNLYDVADIYLNVNEKGYLNLNSGSNYTLYPYRNWLAIEGISNAKVIEPDFNVQVINVEGNPVTVTENLENDSSKHGFNLHANGKGTAIVLVSYDAVTNGAGMTGLKDSSNKLIYGSLYSGIWPENTGVFVVTVGNEDGFDTGMTINEGKNSKSTKLSGDYYDSELDVLYYTGNEGATYTFKPADGTKVSMAVSTISNNKMTFGNFTTSGVTKNADGSFTLTGLKEGKTIVKLTNNGKTEYQVLRSVHTDYQLYKGDKANEELLIYNSKTGEKNDLLSLAAGDTFTVVYSNVYHPANKLSGIYNMSANLLLVGEDNTEAKGTANQYLFASTAATHSVTMKIPQYLNKDSYKVNGMLYSNGFGSPYGMHRILSYTSGKTANFTAGQVPASFGSLPEINLSLSKTDFLESELIFLKSNGSQIPTSKISKVELKDNNGNPISVDENGKFVSLPGTEVSYTVYAKGYKYKTGKFTVDDDLENEFKTAITLEASSENAWDGVTVTEPLEDEDGTYLITSGAELAWYAKEVNESQGGINAKLIANIDLADYPWTPIGAKTNVYTGTIDGNNKEIKGLFLTGSGVLGLVGYMYKDACIKNLTVEGNAESSGATGGFAGYAQYGLIDNCTSRVNIKLVSSSASNVGCIAGYMATSTISNCVNEGTIDVNGNTTIKTGFGGIVGSINRSGKVINCENKGDIDGLSCVGGIVGNTSNYAYVIDGCTNSGNISGIYNAAGIIGNAAGYSSRIGTISNSINYGKITCGTSGGGIVGKVSQYAEFTNCINNAKVETNQFVGTVGTGAKFNRCYALAGSEKDDYSKVISEKATLNDIAATDGVINAINAIGEVTIDSENDIIAANDMYNALSDIQKEMVDNASVLDSANARISALKAEKEEADKKALEEKLKALSENLEALYKTNVEYMSNSTNKSDAIVGSIGGEWWIIGLARAGVDPANKDFYNNYLDTVKKYIEDNILDGEIFHKTKSTENSRIIIALSSLGEDARTFANHNLVKGLNSMKYVKKQGINGPIWALIALDSGAYEPEANENEADAVTRDKLIDYILSMRKAQNGWALSGTKLDPDMTGMALQALAPYVNKRDDVKEAVESALDALSKAQNDNGGYNSWGTENSESADQVIVALTALGIDPLTDSRFIKNGNSVMESMIRFSIENGGFAHTLNTGLNGMATEQGFYALVAYNRFVKGQSRLYDASEEVKLGNARKEEEKRKEEERLEEEKRKEEERLEEEKRKEEEKLRQEQQNSTEEVLGEEYNTDESTTDSAVLGTQNTNTGDNAKIPAMILIMIMCLLTALIAYKNRYKESES